MLFLRDRDQNAESEKQPASTYVKHSKDVHNSAEQGLLRTDDTQHFP